ncbi:MAG: helix-turn-helix domain-containing protein [Microvirga sp.]
MSPLRTLRERAGLTQAELARRSHTSAPQIHRLENGQRKLTREWAERLSPHLLVAAEQILFPESGSASRPAAGNPLHGAFLDEPPHSPLPAPLAAPPDDSLPAPNADLSRIEDAPPRRAFQGPRDVPVKGTAVGGGDGDGDFRFNGDDIDWAPRPAGIAGRKGVYALYVQNDSMYPRYRDGARLYVDANRRPAPGDDVVVELHPREEDGAGPGYVKSFVKQTATTVVVEQFNPPRQIVFEARAVKSLHRVIPQDELLGF